ncbi:MAG: hypothetical protein KIT83_19325 [Bryobacterales bacterium]|nr:hypothetical protein [Bryobacterales bacterium]
MMGFRQRHRGYGHAWLFPVLLLALLSAGARLAAQVRDYDCGNENQQTCRVGQWERYNMRYWTENRCEYDLKPEDGTCVNEKRRLLPPTGGWLGWAMQEQRYRISVDEPINKITWLGSHNAFSNTNQGFNSPLYTNHVYSITDQLNWGVRHLELDPHYFGATNILRSDANRLCHASSTVACLVPGYGQRLLGFALKEIDTWLASNPGEVVVVKLNDKNANGSRMREEIQARIGHRLLPAPTSFQRWPTMREIRNSGRQILFMQHDNNPGVNPTTWNASSLVLSDNWPASQDFNNCLDSAGASPFNRGANSWWDIAEGRSKLNTDLFGTLTGSLEVPNVRRATNCGVAIIGLDFIASLGSEYDVYRPAAPSDLRHAAHIWSWREGDFGGNASFDPQGRRWASRPATEPKRLVCSPERAPATIEQARVWRVTNQAYAWSRLNGEVQCQAEFGTPGNPYMFAFPATALQNRVLGEYLDSMGITEPVWIGYTTGPQDYISVQPSALTFTMSAWANPPAARDIQILGPRGAVYQLASNQQWLSTDRAANFLPADGSVLTQPVALNKAASELSPGTYAAVLGVILPASGSRPLVQHDVDVKLRVLVPTLTTITGPATSPLGASPELRIQVSTNPVRSINGSIELVRLSQGMEEPLVQQISASDDRRVIVEGLPIGLHRFYASYLGSDELQPSDSQVFELTVTPRVGLNPSLAAFNMTSGGALPAPQAVQVSNLSSGAAVAPLSNCPWLSATLGSISGSTASVSLQPQPPAQALPAGDYACQFEVSDSLSGTLGSSTLEATLRVTTSLVSIPATVPAFLVGSQPQSTQLVVATPFGESIAIRTSSSCPELRFAAENPVTAATVQILATRGDRAPDTYLCELRVESDFVPNPLLLPVTLQVVNPTVVDTNPPDLSYLVDGLSYTGRNEFTWQPGTTRQISTTFEQSSVPGTRHRFQNWSSGAAQTQQIIANANGASYAANFSTEHLLTRQSVPAQGGASAAMPVSADGYYPAGTFVQLSSNPASGFQATGFSGAGVTPLTATTASVLMNAPRTVTANFAAATLTPITIQTNAPNATLTVDGQPQPLPVTLLLEQGRQYRFVAPGFVEENPASVWVFSQWQGAQGSNVVDYVVTSQPATLNINYRRQVLYTFSASPAVGGAISNNGWQLATGQLPIQATPAEGYRFVRWTGDLVGQPNPVTLPVDRPLTATAEFALLAQPTLVVMPGGARSDGIEPGTRRVPLRLSNRGSGLAPASRILGVTNIRVLAGSGLVAATTPLPLSLGSIAPNDASSFELLFQWPATATRIQFTVVFDAGEGLAAGSTTLSLFR